MFECEKHLDFEIKDTTEKRLLIMTMLISLQSFNGTELATYSGVFMLLATFEADNQ